MTDRTVLHRTDLLPPEGAGGALIVPIEVIDITGAAMREDHQAVALKLLAASGDRIIMGMSAPMVDAMLETLRKIRSEMDANGVEGTIPFAPIHTLQVGTHVVDKVPFVSMILDRSLQSAAAYLIPPKGARVLSEQLKQAARTASTARGENGIITPRIDE